MDFFKKRVVSDSTSQMRGLPFGSGRRLRSERPLADCLANFEACIFSSQPPESEYRSAYVFPGWQWLGAPEKSPEFVISCNYSNKEFLLVAFWSYHDCAECALFPLGSGDERLLSLPIIDAWHGRDPSLRSIGLMPGGQIALTPPRLSEQFFRELLTTAGFPMTLDNLQMLGMKIGEILLARAHQFIAPRDPQGADRFMRNHRYNGGSFQQYCQSILDDLVAWNPDILPYIQDTPMRIRAIALKAIKVPGSMWNSFEQPKPAVPVPEKLLSDTLERSPQPSAPELAVSDTPESWVKKGVAHCDDGRYAEALACYDRALDLDVHSIEALKQKGITLRKLKRYEEALAVYDRALALDPDNVHIWNNKGNVLSDMGRLEDALAHSEKAVALAPNNAACWYCKGCTLADLGRHQEALVAYERALELKSDYIDALGNKGTTLLNHLGRHEEALAAFVRALELNPRHALTWANKGAALAEMGRFQEALAAFEHTLELDPNSVDAWFNLGNVFHALELYEKALIAYDRACELAPDYAEAWNNKGIMLTNLGYYEKALATFNHAVALDPYHANAWRNKGVLLRALGNLQEADFAEERARQLS